MLQARFLLFLLSPNSVDGHINRLYLVCGFNIELILFL